MKKYIKSIATMMLALIVTFGMIAPVGSDAASKYVKSLTLSKTTVSVNAGKTAKVTATVKVSGSASKGISVSTSSKSIATVTKGSLKSGKTTITISGKKKGTAYITVKTVGKNKSKKYITKKIKVNVGYASVSSLKVPVTSKTLRNGETVSVKGTVSPSTANLGVTYSSSDTSVATVSSTGIVTAVSSGQATITVKTKGTNSSGSYVTKTAAITVCNFDESDYSVSYGTQIKHVEFKINTETTTQAELEKLGYTVKGGVASKDEECMTATYTFTSLPTTLDELKKISLASDVKNGEYGSYDYGMFGPMAATVCAMHTWGADWNNRTTKYTVANNPLCAMMGYIGGPTFTPNNYDAQAIADALVDHRELRNSYFVGAAPSNSYTPSEPYQITMYEGPYYIPAKTTINGYRPETHMIFVTSAGADTDRYLDVYYMENNWYSYNKAGVYKNLLASVKTPWY